MYTSLLTPIFLLLSVLHATVLAGAVEYAPGPILTARQAGGASAPECLDYARTANLSTVGANSTYRATFLQMSSTGTIYDAAMFSEAMGKLPAMTANQDLNQQCGNFTEIALTEAERNFTQRTVLQFDNVIQDAQVIKAGPDLIAILVLIIGIFFGVWCFAP